MATHRIFLSRGTPYTHAQVKFYEDLEEILRDRCDFDPRILSKNEYAPGNPLRKIKDVMSTCSGVLIVAMERKQVTSGAERRSSEFEEHPEVPLSNAVYPTPWNQIEAAMAYSLGLPIFVLAEQNIRLEGLFSITDGWGVHKFDLDNSNPGTFAPYLRSWKEEVIEPTIKNKNPKVTDIQAIKLKDLPSVLSLQIIGTMTGVVVAAFSLGVWMVKSGLLQSD